MNYNPEQIEGKRPRAGEVWEGDGRKVEVVGRRTVSGLIALGRYEKLSEVDDHSSLVMYWTLDKQKLGITHEKEFCELHTFVGKAKS